MLGIVPSVQVNIQNIISCIKPFFEGVLHIFTDGVYTQIFGVSLVGFGLLFLAATLLFKVIRK